MGCLNVSNNIVAGFPGVSDQRGIPKPPCSYDSVLSVTHCCHTLIIRSESMNPTYSGERSKTKVLFKGVMGLLKPQPIRDYEICLQEL